MKLGEISSIESGLILSRKRSRNNFEFVKEYKVLSLNNIQIQGDFNEKELEYFQSNDELEDHYFTKPGHILLRLNAPFTSVYINEDKAGILIPSFFVSIKIKHKDFLPQYVSWYLNTDNVKRHFLRMQSGTRTPNVNQQLLRSLEIPSLSFKDQKNITALHQLYLKERRLLKELIKEKDKYYEGITTEIIREKMRDY